MQRTRIDQQDTFVEAPKRLLHPRFDPYMTQRNPDWRFKMQTLWGIAS